MSTILVPDFIRQLTDEEVNTGKIVRVGTWQDVVSAINYCNFYARKVVPFVSLGDRYTNYEFIAPISSFGLSTRKIGVIVALAPSESSSTPWITNLRVQASSGDYSDIQFTNYGFSSAWDKYSEENVTYGFATVFVDDGSRDRITINRAPGASADPQIVGVGAWEMPHTEGMTDYMQGPGITKGTASVNSLYSMYGVPDPSNYLGDDLVDADNIYSIRFGHDFVIEKNRRVSFSSHPAMNLRLSTSLGYHSTSTWYKYPTGGIYIPPYASSREYGLLAYRPIRVAIRANYTTGGTSPRLAQWRVSTSIGTYGGLTVSDDEWDPMSPTGSYDRTQLGQLAYVGLTGEWIYVEMQTTNADVYVSINQIEVWEDEP